MAAAGKVITGFSAPFVAKYAATGTAVTYSGGIRLARGVNVSIAPSVADDNNFYADNVIAETEAGVFTGGEVTLEVDGLLDEAEELIFGLPEPQTLMVGERSVAIKEYGAAMQIPYVGIGFVIRCQSDGLSYYTPVVLTKARFAMPETEAATQEENIDWQSQTLTATLMRDDTEDHNWKKVAEDQATEEAAIAVIQTILGIAA